MEDELKKAIKALLDKREKAKTGSQEAARKWLTAEGLLDDDGELQPQFGGPAKPGKPD